MSVMNDVVMMELDRPRQLRYGYKAIKMMISMLDMDVADISEMEVDFGDLEQIEKIIYCGLLSDAKSNGEDLKLDAMEDLLDLQPLSYTMEKMTEAFSASFGTMVENHEVEDESEAKND